MQSSTTSAWMCQEYWYGPEAAWRRSGAIECSPSAGGGRPGESSFSLSDEVAPECCDDHRKDGRRQHESADEGRREEAAVELQVHEVEHHRDELQRRKHQQDE